MPPESEVSINARPNKTGALIAVSVVAILSAYLLYPALFLDRSLVHEDNLHHGYALLKFHYDVIHQGLSPLWSNLIYGGHPIFAEGQAGLSNPIQYLVAWLFRPEFGHNLLHWLAMVVFGTGCYGLARTLSLTSTAAFFAMLAATFSSLTLHTHSNMMAVSAMAWVPVTMWTFEAWLKYPSPKRAIVFGLATAMLVFSGYPQFLHGTVIYLLISMSTLFTRGPLKHSATVFAKRYLPGGLIAILVCLAISSVQWLPLLELATLSHRQAGVDIGMGGTPTFLLQGLLYTIDISPPNGDRPIPYFPNIGSMTVCFFALLSLALPSNPRFKGHIIASLVLLNLGLGDGSPIYSLARADTSLQ